MSNGEPLKPKEDKFYEFKPFRVPKYRVQFQRAGKLADVPGYVWYTPAPLYLWGRFTETNLSDLVQQYNIQIFWYRFDRPIFDGFIVNGDPSWNHTLWAAREDQWKQLVDGILETVQFDIPNARLYQYAMQTLQVYDPLSIDVQRVLTQKTPVIDIHAFAVLSNIGQYAFDTRKKAVAVKPRVVGFKPSKLHKSAARRLFAQQDLTQDKAFARYKEIMLQGQDESFERKRKKKQFQPKDESR